MPLPQVILGLVHSENRWGMLPAVKFELIDLYDMGPAVHIGDFPPLVSPHSHTFTKGAMEMTRESSSYLFSIVTVRKVLQHRDCEG